MSIVIMVVVFIVKELNDKFKARLPVPIPIEVIMVRYSSGKIQSNVSPHVSVNKTSHVTTLKVPVAVLSLITSCSSMRALSITDASYDVVTSLLTDCHSLWGVLWLQLSGQIWG